MKTIKVNQIYGNYDLVVEVDVDEQAHRDILFVNGALQTLQRVPASKADKAIDGKNWKPGKKEGTLLKPEKWSRTQNIPFKQEVADAFLRNDVFGQDMEIAEGVKVPIRVVKVTEHESGEASPMKRATAFVELMFGGPLEPTMRETFTKLGMQDADTATKDELIAFANTKGLGADPKKV